MIDRIRAGLLSSAEQSKRRRFGLAFWCGAERFNLKVFIRENPQQVKRCSLALIQPLGVFTRLQDDGLTVMNLRHLRIRIISDDCERIFPLSSLRILPRSPQASHFKALLSFLLILWM
jgi:hypothetical protein